MKYLFNFLESLNPQWNVNTLEFETTNEQLIIAEGTNKEIFVFFGKATSITRNNLCKEIIFLKRENAHIIFEKEHNEWLRNYYYAKLKKEEFNPEDYQISVEFIQELEKHLINSERLNKIYWHLKLEEKLPEKSIQIKKHKI